jgi:hypothetical protein
MSGSARPGKAKSVHALINAARGAQRMKHRHGGRFSDKKVSRGSVELRENHLIQIKERGSKS